MNIDPVLLEILACPCEHHAPLDAVQPAGTEGTTGDGALVCTRCRTSFPVRDDIPIMLLDEATPGPSGVGTAVAEQT
jgi:uncharacterized protein YbaR (Trm112 family)